MNDLFKKVAVWGSGVALLLGSTAPTFAATWNLTASGNGSSSVVDITLSDSDDDTTSQTQSGDTTTDITDTDTTGDNTVEDNTGPGTFSVLSGDTDTMTTVMNEAHWNEVALTSASATPPDVTAEASNNGSGAAVTLSGTATRVRNRTQDNSRNRTTTLNRTRRSGGNTVARNTNSTASATSGDMDDVTSVTTEGDTNLVN